MKTKLGVVLLAAGRSERFGANKLLADFDGVPMVCRALRVLREIGADQAVAVVSCAQVERLVREYGFTVVYNEAPQLGMARSICLGMAAMKEMDAVMLMVADQPLLTADSLRELVCAFEDSARAIACLCDETHSGNPAVFSRLYFDRLMRLEGDSGAKRILRENEDDLLVVRCLREGELADADTPQTLLRLQMEKPEF